MALSQARHALPATGVYSSADCFYGMLGAEGRFCFGTQIMGFDRMIHMLLALEYGSARAIRALGAESH